MFAPLFFRLLATSAGTGTPATRQEELEAKYHELRNEFGPKGRSIRWGRAVIGTVNGSNRKKKQPVT